MVWKLDDIDLEDYGVIVSKSSGVFDFPEMVDKSTNWLDENGKDYWQALGDVKYQDREINLNCYILAGDYADFKAKVTAFYAAITSEGKKQLETPFDKTIEVSVQQAVQLTRVTSYVQSLQCGVFTLKLTVTGDVDFYTLNIHRYYTTNTIATVFTRDLKIQKTLQGDSYATFSFESNKKLDIRFFDEIDINTNGINLDRFYFESEPKPRQYSTNKFVYEIKAMHMGNWLSHSEFLNDLGESDFSYYANLDEIIVLLLNNHGRDYFARKFLKGTIEATERKLHQFSGENCLTVLRRLCSEYKLEFEFEFEGEIDGMVLWRYFINIKQQVANDKTITLEYGKGNGLYEITPGEMLADEFYTCLFAFGAAKNLKPDYRGGLRRLSFAGNPLKKNYGFDFENGNFGVKSKTIFYDEIYPRRTGSVTAYLQKLPAELTESEKYAHPEGIFKPTDSTIDFNVNDYLTGGLTAKMVMKTGDCAGMQFEINQFDNATKEFYIIPYKDERGELYPNANLTIQVGDDYTLIDIDQPSSYVALAEAELEAAAQSDLDAHCVPKYPYTVTVHQAFIQAQTQPFGFEAGDRVPFIFPEHGVDGPLRISSLVYDAYKGTYELTLSEIVKTARLKKTDMRLDAIERSINAAGLDKTETTQKSQETTSELRNRILDPTDDKLNADRNIRKESIDPFMLSPDASTPQVSISGGLVSTTETTVVIESGVFYSHNFNAKTRKEIAAL